MASSINASTTAGVVTTADTSGVLALQTAGTTAVTVDASQNVTLAGTLTTTGVATFAAGTAAAPAITTTGDTNTGIFFPAADTIGFSEGGVEAMRINASGNVVITGTLTTAAQSIAKASLPTGSVLQVVNGTYSITASNSTTTYADTGLTASITPSSATSKILVVVHQADPYKSATNTGSGISIKLVRGATDIVTFGVANCYTGTALQNNGTTISTSFLDSPATTSSTTYKTQFANFTSAATVGLQASGGTSTITLMEIAA